MNKSALLICIILLLAACKKQQFNINCHLDGLNNDSVIIGFTPQSNLNDEVMDTAIAKNGIIKYYFPANELNEGVIIPFDLIYKFKNGRSYPLPSSRIRFFINKGDNIIIKGSIKDQIRI